MNIGNNFQEKVQTYTRYIIQICHIPSLNLAIFFIYICMYILHMEKEWRLKKDQMKIPEQKLQYIK